MKTKENAITLQENGDIKFGTKRIETPANTVTSINKGVITFLINNDKAEVSMDLADYCGQVAWANRIVFDHGFIPGESPRIGVVAFDNGWEHKSLPAAIMQTHTGQRVGYRDGNKFNLRRSNLYIKGASC